MLTLLTGKTGSGKSYKAVENILASLSEGRTVFSNIWLNYDSDKFHYLDELQIKTFLQYINNTFDNVHNLDDKKAELNRSIYAGADFYIDEAHLLGFQKKTDSILNWLTLHRHFNQNITVITQIPQNLNRDYLPLFHSHIEMLPSNKRLAKGTMGYRLYDAYKGDRLETKFFKPVSTIFEVYNTGANDQSSNKDVRKAIILISIVVLLGVLFFFFSSSFYSNLTDVQGKTFGDTNTTDSNVSVVSSSQKVVTVSTDLNTSEDIGYVSDNAYCKTDGYCYIGFTQIKYEYFKKYILPKYTSYNRSVLLRSSAGYSFLLFEFQ